MKIKILIGCFIVIRSFVFGQQLRILPLETNFRDAAFYSDSVFVPVFPISTQQSTVYELLQEKKKRYSSFGHFVYQRELLQVIKPKGALWITPLFNLQLGAERGDTARRQFLNVRGARIEGSMKNKVFFSSSFYENQAILPLYAQQYVNNRGEFYPNANDSTYQQVNAAIPGAARTKPFKSDGFDYAYAFGVVHWQILKNLSVSAGNTPVFIGNGYRSLLFSDNAMPSMNFRIQYSLNKRWDFQTIRIQGLNLLRLPFHSNGESLYERKAFSINSVYFKATKNIQIGVVETGVWSRGDSLQKLAVEGAFYIPAPGGATLQEGINKKANSYLGIDINTRFWKMHAYAQYGRNLFHNNSDLLQIGLRYWPFNSHNYLIQIEYNHTSINAYQSSNPRINYSNYNLPTGHPMAAGVDELVVRIRAEWEHLFMYSQTNFYLNQQNSLRQLLPVYENINSISQKVFLQKIELGYSFNRNYGFEVFGSFQYRSLIGPANSQYYWLNVGIRTALTNHYFDF